MGVKDIRLKVLREVRGSIMDRNTELKNIPDEMKRLDQWVIWKPKNVDGKIKKIPYQPSDPTITASSTNPDTWSSYGQAIDRSDKIGFVFSEDDNIIGIDLDNCFYDGEMADWAEDLINNLDSYTEYSPSMNGLHIIAKGDPKFAGKEAGFRVSPQLVTKKDKERSIGGEQIEVYKSGRYFTVTGRTYGNTGASIMNRTQQLESLFEELHYSEGDEEKQVAAPILSIDNTARWTTNEEIIEKIRGEGDLWEDLWKGDWDKHTDKWDSPSNATLALCNKLAFWTRKNREWMDELFRKSGMMRPKWDERRGNTTWGAGRIEKACAGTTKVYEPEFDPTEICKSLLQQERIDGRHWKYVIDQGLWYLYDSGYWRQRDEGYVIKKVRETLRNKNPKWNRLSKVREVLEELKFHIANPADKNIFTRPDPRYNHLINTRDGMLDWKDMTLIEHSPRYFSMFQIPIHYDPEAECPMWRKAMKDWLVDDDDLIMFLQEFIGYCLIPDASMDTSVILLGEGKNGKSTFIDVVNSLVGHENTTAIPLDRLSNRFEIRYLQGALANFCPDIDPNYINNSGQIKSAISGEQVRAEVKHGESYDLYPVARFLFSANELPKSADKTYGWYRRINIVRFPQSFEGEKEIPNFEEKLKQELPGIFNWAVEGLRRLMRRGKFDKPQAVTDELDDYIESNDTVVAFIQERINTNMANAALPTKYLYRMYREYCADVGAKPVRHRRFSRRLNKEGLEKGVRRFNVCVAHDRYKCQEESCKWDRDSEIKKQRNAFLDISLE